MRSSPLSVVMQMNDSLVEELSMIYACDKIVGRLLSVSRGMRYFRQILASLLSKRKEARWPR